MAAVNIASRRELMVDDHLIDTLSDGADLTLQHPIPREVVITHDEPWEGCTSAYHTIFRDGDVVRMYYRGSHADVNEPKKLIHPQVACYAESRDGIHWEKPNLGLREFEGSTDNNIIWSEPDVGTHNFCPFKDPNPDCAPGARYKAVCSHQGKLHVAHSPDGIHWTAADQEPLNIEGKFDSQNLAFFDTVRGEYRCYFRVFDDGRRTIWTAISPDFITWSERVQLEYPGQPKQQLYTNAILPYYRAPHLFIGFPTRYMADRDSVTEGLFMSSRDGVVFNQWGEALIRPGLNPARWGNRSNYIWWGVVETASDVSGAPDELSIYSIEGYYAGESNCVRRFTYRIDGFVSLNAPLAGGEVITKPLTFEGARLSMNVSTSAGGAMRVALLDEDAREIEGFGLADTDEFYGDTLDHTATWQGSADVSTLAGKPIRLRIALSDADLYSLKFEPGEDA